MTPANGSTEIWLGAHNNDISAQEGAHGDRGSGCIKQDLLEKNRAIRGLCQPVVKKGMRLQFAENMTPILEGRDRGLNVPVDWKRLDDAAPSHLGEGLATVPSAANTTTPAIPATPATPSESKELPFLTTLKSSKKLQDSILPKIGSNIDLGKANTMQDLINQLSDAELARLTAVFNKQDMARLSTSGFAEADLAKLASLPAPAPAPAPVPAPAPAPAPAPVPATFLSAPETDKEKFVKDSKDFSAALAELFEEAGNDKEEEVIFDSVLSFLGLEVDDVFDAAKVEVALLGKMSQDVVKDIPSSENGREAAIVKRGEPKAKGKEICPYDHEDLSGCQRREAHEGHKELYEEAVRDLAQWERDYKEQEEGMQRLFEKEDRLEREAMEKAKKKAD